MWLRYSVRLFICFVETHEFFKTKKNYSFLVYGLVFCEFLLLFRTYFIGKQVCPFQFWNEFSVSNERVRFVHNNDIIVQWILFGLVQHCAFLSRWWNHNRSRVQTNSLDGNENKAIAQWSRSRIILHRKNCFYNLIIQLYWGKKSIDENTHLFSSLECIWNVISCVLDGTEILKQKLINIHSHK